MKLKPCPFCGKPVSVYYSSATKGYYAVHSDEQNSECIVLMPLLINGHHLFVCLSDAIEAWNRRATDAVPVVMCKDCKWWREETDHTCRKWGGASPRNANGYCDDAERRTDEET